jgi:hypothetical protein
MMHTCIFSVTQPIRISQKNSNKKIEIKTQFMKIFFIVAPCILISSKSFIYQQMHFISVLENIKIYIKTYIKIAPTCFGLQPSSGSLRMSLAKVMFTDLINVTLARLIHKLPDDGHSPKHVGAILI